MKAVDSSIASIKVAYIQDGARMHYSQPLALHRQGMLCALYTDWYNDESLVAKAVVAVARRINFTAATRMAQRCHPDLTGVPVYHHPLLGLLVPLAWKRSTPVKAVGRWTLARMAGSELNYGPLAGRPYYPDAVMGPVLCFSPEGVHLFKSRGIRVIVDQVSFPASAELRERAEQRAQWPEWEEQKSARVSEDYVRSQGAVLASADHVLAATDYVKSLLLASGLPDGKVSVLTYPLDTTGWPLVERSRRTGPIMIGFVGGVRVMKGIPWLVETLKQVDPKLFRCVVVGKSLLSDYGLAELRKVAEVIGPVPRSEVAHWMEKFDVFFFPSVCEGFGGVVAEAMATGLPVITSPVAGHIVREGIDGFVRPYDQPDEYAKCITLLAKDKKKRLAMGTAARERVEKFSVDGYGAGLRKIIEGVAGAVL